MQITVTKTGGFAGVNQQLGPVDTSSLDSRVADDVSRIIREVDFFNLPRSLPKSGQMSDAFYYAVSATDGSRNHTVQMGDDSSGSAADKLRELIRVLEQAVGFGDSGAAEA
jgi:hypothetical protein